MFNKIFVTVAIWLVTQSIIQLARQSLSQILNRYSNSQFPHA